MISLARFITLRHSGSDLRRDGSESDQSKTLLLLSTLCTGNRAEVIGPESEKYSKLSCTILTRVGINITRGGGGGGCKTLVH